MSTTIKTIKQLEENIKLATEFTKALEFKSVECCSSITLTKNSSKKQIIYAYGLVSSQLNASLELGFEEEVELLTQKLEDIQTLSSEIENNNIWKNYIDEATKSIKQLKGVLSVEERLHLIEIPSTPLSLIPA